MVLTPSGGGKSRLALGVLSTNGRGSARRRRRHPRSLRQGLSSEFPHPIGVSHPDAATGLRKSRSVRAPPAPAQMALELDALDHRTAVDPHPVVLTGALPTGERFSTEPGASDVANGRPRRPSLRDLVIGTRAPPGLLELVARRGADRSTEARPLRCSPDWYCCGFVETRSARSSWRFRIRKQQQKSS